MAHPDDAEICLGGTLARMVDRGHDVTVLICSLPDKPNVRRGEALYAASIIGNRVEFLRCGRKSWQVEDIPMYELVRRIDAFVITMKPNIIFTHWAEDPHYDHVLVSRASISVARNNYCDLFMCEQSNLRTPSSKPFPVNTYTDITAYNDIAIRSIKAHESQLINKQHIANKLSRVRLNGIMAGCKYAEAFHCVRQHLKL